MCLTYVESHFQKHQWSAFFFMAQITQILLFSGMSVLERSKITVPERELFKYIFCYEKFRYVFTLRKEVFSEAPLKFFFLYCLNNSDSVISVNSGIPELKDQSLRTTPFQEYFCYGRSVSIIKICLDLT